MTNCFRGAGGERGGRIRLQIATDVMTVMRATRLHGIALFHVTEAVPTGKESTDVPTSAVRLNPAIKSAALCHLSSGSFSRHLFTTQSSNSGVMG
jgi:hypothetical protein